MQSNGHTPAPGKFGGSVVCKTPQGVAIEADVLRMTPHLVVFEVFDPGFVLQMSEVLADFRINLDGRAVYSGRAVVASLVQTGTKLMCEATLDEACLDARALCAASDLGQVRAGFEGFVRDWGKAYRVLPEFKVILVDLQGYLSDLRLWLEQVELGIRSAPSGDRSELERKVLVELRPPVISALNALFEKFELAAARVEPDDRPAHRACVRRQIHPLVFSAPFPYRTFHKPLGYPGDYEMVNMILRDPFEGGSLFAKALNSWFLAQPPAEAHRNRIVYLTRTLVRETARVAALGRKARIFNLGCGPAVEVQRFLAEHDISNHADLTLLDFNNETLAYTTAILQDLKTRHHRATKINLIKKSVGQILKGRGKSTNSSAETKFDLVYCAGLFDYLADQHCQQLMNIFYDMLAPGGLLVATNVDSSNPRCLTMEYMMEWVVIYRNGAQMAALKPDAVLADDLKVESDVTGVNIYFETRKPLRE